MPESRVIGNRFEFRDPHTGLLGQGAMGQVFRGLDRWSGEPVAIKALKSGMVARDPDLVARFEREGEALRQLNHPNIVKMLAAVTEQDANTGDEIHYLVMEYVGGGSLRDLLDQQTKLPVQRVLQIGIELADALSRAHHLNIIHRDIKPDNVLLAEDGTPRLTDFGVARLADRPQLTQTGMIIGTVHYLSPEACNGEKLDARADIWALGVMLFEMLTGIVPFRGENLMAIIAAILAQPAPDLLQYCPDAPFALGELISQMLQKDPEARISSARLVAAQLEAIRKNQEVQKASPAMKMPFTIAMPQASPVEMPQEVASSTRRNQYILLKKVHNFWITGVLNKGAPDAEWLEIAKRSVNEAVERPWERVAGAQTQPAGDISSDKSTLQIFQDADRSLLILGEPGAGKTVALLKLARALIALAEKDPYQPVPVVLNLASWGEKRTPIADWVALELTAKYQIPRKMGHAWLEENDLILILDDFDEIPARYLPDAIRAINQFREAHGLAGILIASRTEAYQGAGVRLKLGGRWNFNLFPSRRSTLILKEAGLKPLSCEQPCIGMRRSQR
jgi:serine/threonine protein kinase